MLGEKKERERKRERKREGGEGGRERVGLRVTLSDYLRVCTRLYTGRLDRF